MRTTASLMGHFATSLAIASLLGSVALAGYTTTLGVENQFYDLAGWDVGDLDSTYQEWDSKGANSDNVPDHGYQTNPMGLTDPTHSVKPPGFRTGTNNFYSFSGNTGATANIYNHGGSSGGGGYGPTHGTHVIVQTGSTQNYDPVAWGSHTELVSGHGIGNFWETMKLVDLAGDPIPGGENASALAIAEVSFRVDVPTSMGDVDYQELIYEFWLPGYAGDFRVDWDQIVHGTIDTLRVDSMIGVEAAGGGSPFVLTIPEPATVGLFGSGLVACVGVLMIRRRRAMNYNTMKAIPLCVLLSIFALGGLQPASAGTVVPADEDVMTSPFFMGEDRVRGYDEDDRNAHRVSTENPFGMSGAETVYMMFDYDFAANLAGPVPEALLSVESTSGGFGADAGPGNPFTVSAHAVDADPLASITDDTNPEGPIDWLTFYNDNILAATPAALTIVDGFGTVTFDVTSIVNDWIAGSNTVHAIALTGKNDTSGNEFLHGFLNNSENSGSTFLRIVPEPSSMVLLLGAAIVVLGASWTQPNRRRRDDPSDRCACGNGRSTCA